MTLIGLMNADKNGCPSCIPLRPCASAGEFSSFNRTRMTLIGLMNADKNGCSSCIPLRPCASAGEFSSFNRTRMMLILTDGRSSTFSEKSNFFAPDRRAAGSAKVR